MPGAGAGTLAARVVNPPETGYITKKEYLWTVADNASWLPVPLPGSAGRSPRNFYPQEPGL